MPHTQEELDKIEQDVALLETRADQLRELLKYAPRPFIIEFAGTPKSGKSTSVEAVKHFLTRHDFRVHVLSERAAVCPIPMKGHLFFNTWCASSMLAELLENIDTDTDIIVVDRGLFDALVWLTLQEKRGELNSNEARTFERFLLLERWKNLTDLVVVMNVSAEDAQARENAQRITRKTGSIMNRDVLAALSESVKDAVANYSGKFKRVLEFNTSGEEVRVSGIRLTNEILDRLQQFLNPKILVVPRKAIERLVSTGEGFDDDAFGRALNCIKEFGEFVERDVAENKKDLVQIVTAGVLVHNNTVFLFQRREADPKSQLYGKSTIWQGSHIQKDNGEDLTELLLATLRNRLSRDLFLSRRFDTRELGYCWDADHPVSSLHFGMMYDITIDNPHTAADLRKKEFKRKRGHGLGGRFIPWVELAENADELRLESWSRALLNSKKIE